MWFIDVRKKDKNINNIRNGKGDLILDEVGIFKIIYKYYNDFMFNVFEYSWEVSRWRYIV